jgi:excisionase family DNA binding protein
VLTVKSCAEQLGVSPALVYALCAADKIHHERHGLGRGVIRISEAALEAYRRAASRGCKQSESEEQPCHGN